MYSSYILRRPQNFCEISTLLLSYVVPVKSKVEISQNFVAFSEYMNFKVLLLSFKRRSNPDCCIYIAVTSFPFCYVHLIGTGSCFSDQTVLQSSCF